jgi:hypothetical protein
MSILAPEIFEKAQEDESSFTSKTVVKGIIAVCTAFIVMFGGADAAKLVVGITQSANGTATLYENVFGK